MTDLFAASDALVQRTTISKARLARIDAVVAAARMVIEDHPDDDCIPLRKLRDALDAYGEDR